jgi:hypothetical protein
MAGVINGMSEALTVVDVLMEDFEVDFLFFVVLYYRLYMIRREFFGLCEVGCMSAGNSAHSVRLPRTQATWSHTESDYIRQELTEGGKKEIQNSDSRIQNIAT